MSVDVKKEMEVTKTGLESVQLPEGNRIDIMSDEVIARIDLPLMKVIGQKYSSTVICPLLESHASIQTVIETGCLKSEAILSESVFWELVSRMYVLIESGVVEYLQAKKFLFQENEDESSYLARVFTEKPDLLTDYLTKLIQQNGNYIGGKRYQIFQGKGLNDFTVSLSNPKINANKLQEKLELAFFGSSYGKYREVVQIKHPECIAFLVKRGAKRKTDTVLDTEEKQRFRSDRKIKTDAIFYYPETNTLWIHCFAKNDASKYATAFGNMLGNENFFTTRQNFDTAPFLNKNLGSEFLSVIPHVEGVVRIEVKKVDVELAKGGNHKQPAKHDVRCLTTIFHGMDAISPQNDMKSITLRLVLSTDSKLHADIEVQSGTLKIGTKLHLSTVTQLLTQLKVWKPYAEA